MLKWFRKKKVAAEATPAAPSPQPERPREEYSFVLYQVGDENPFNKEILDIRAFTSQMRATTKDESVALKYTTLRHSNGEEYVDTQVPQSRISATHLEYPHNGAALEGIVFKADAMECKWDIYAYHGVFYFTRSWTGNLRYKVQARILSDKIIFTQVEHDTEEDSVQAINTVHFLMKSHAFKQPFPHMIPQLLTDGKEIAMWSFSQFGNRADFATYEEITDTTIKSRE